MKIQDFSSGEGSNKENLNHPKSSETATLIAFAQFWPQSSSLKEFDGEWLEFDEADVGCRIRNRLGRALENSCNLFMEKFLSRNDIGITLKNLIAKNSLKIRNQRTVLLATGSGVSSEVTDKLSKVIAFISERLIQEQADLFFCDESHGLTVKEIEFLLSQVDKIRELLSGDKITHPFGVETLGSKPRVAAFSGHFDIYEYELPPAEEVSGEASVDGFRDFHNTAFLNILIDEEVVEPSKVFRIDDTSIIGKINDAKHSGANVRYIAEKIYETHPDKPTFVLKEIEILS